MRTAFVGICRRLNRTLPHDHAGIALYEAGCGELRLFTQHAPAEGPGLPEGFALALDGPPAGEAYRLQRPVVVEDLRSPQFTCETTRELLKLGTRSGCWVPLRTAHGVFGALWVSSSESGAYGMEDGFLVQEAAGPIALALAHQLNVQQLEEMEQRLRAQNLVASTSLGSMADTGAVGVVQWEEGARLTNGNDAYLRIAGHSREEMLRGLSLAEVTPPEYQRLHRQAEQELRSKGFRRPFEDMLLRPDGGRVPVLVTAGSMGKLCPPWPAFVMDLREKRTLPKTAVAALPVITAKETEALAANSPAMYKILSDLKKVAPTDATLLLLGETGTGKDVLAHTICQMSPRRRHPFIKVNCAAGLLESELFGHEKGAFTGAQSRKIGRIELADHGTLFLDEVGDVPLELQPKLLRVLQEREFERLGGTQTIRVDIRVVAATNRDLGRMSGSGLFRRDLFYRLNVFPVRVPPLRERPESVPMLLKIFVEKFAKRMNRPDLSVPPATVEALEHWCWPGNIRELENLVERAVILSPGPDLRVNLEELQIEPTGPEEGENLLDLEREHIRHILRDTNGVIGGKRGAASRLGLKRTTLQYKMKKLEIDRY